MKLLIKRIFSLWPFRLWLCWHGCRNSDKVALTFDDGPRVGFTNEVLDILEAENILVTFFLEGRWVEKNSELVAEIINAGHEVGNHGYDHSNVGGAVQMAKGAAALQKVGVMTRLYRPALGKISFKEFIYFCMKGYRTVLWSFDMHDSMRHEGKWSGATPDYFNIQGGDIILMHDDNPLCIDELPSLIRTVKERQFQFVSVSALVGM